MFGCREMILDEQLEVDGRATPKHPCSLYNNSAAIDIVCLFATLEVAVFVSGTRFKAIRSCWARSLLSLFWPLSMTHVRMDLDQPLQFVCTFQCHIENDERPCERRRCCSTLTGAVISSLSANTPRLADLGWQGRSNRQWLIERVPCAITCLPTVDISRTMSVDDSPELLCHCLVHGVMLAMIRHSC